MPPSVGPRKRNCEPLWARTGRPGPAQSARFCRLQTAEPAAVLLGFGALCRRAERWRCEARTHPRRTRPKETHAHSHFRGGASAASIGQPERRRRRHLCAAAAAACPPDCLPVRLPDWLACLLSAASAAAAASADANNAVLGLQGARWPSVRLSACAIVRLCVSLSSFFGLLLAARRGLLRPQPRPACLSLVRFHPCSLGFCLIQDRRRRRFSPFALPILQSNPSSTITLSYYPTLAVSYSLAEKAAAPRLSLHKRLSLFT